MNKLKKRLLGLIKEEYSFLDMVLVGIISVFYGYTGRVFITFILFGLWLLFLTIEVEQRQKHRGVF
jgi:hypothetical protein